MQNKGKPRQIGNDKKQANTEDKRSLDKRIPSNIIFDHACFLIPYIEDIADLIQVQNL